MAQQIDKETHLQGRKVSGCIYVETYHHKGVYKGGFRRVRGVGMVRRGFGRWVAEIQRDGKRFRKRSYNFDVVKDWLNEMRIKLN